MNKQLCLCMLGWLVFVGPIQAQETNRSVEPDDPMSRPTKYGIRITPGLVRLLSKDVTRGLFGDLSQMDEEQRKEISEMVARRVMEAAHKMDGPGQELIERFIEEQIKFAESGGRAIIPPTFGKEFAERVKPLLPTIRDMCNHIAGDVRPMLPIKEQLSLAGKLVGFNTAFDAFEYTIDEWAKGNVPESGDPFHQDSEDQPKQEDAPNIEVQVREHAESFLEKDYTAKWEKYVQEAKEYYQLDKAQCATADSILRELTQRVEPIISDEDWQHRVYCNRLWHYLEERFLRQSNHPFQLLNNRHYRELLKPIYDLEKELTRRIDTIPRRAQRQKAEVWILKKMTRHLGEEAAQTPFVIDEKPGNVESDGQERQETESVDDTTGGDDQ